MRPRGELAALELGLAFAGGLGLGFLLGMALSPRG
jgi:hypothetical protein